MTSSKHFRSSSALLLLRLARDFATADQVAAIDKRIFAAEDAQVPVTAEPSADPAVLVAEPQQQEHSHAGDQVTPTRPQEARDGEAAVPRSATDLPVGATSIIAFELTCIGFPRLEGRAAVRPLGTRAMDSIVGALMVPCSSTLSLQVGQQAREGGARRGQGAQPRQSLCDLPDTGREEARRSPGPPLRASLPLTSAAVHERRGVVAADGALRRRCTDL